MKCFAPIWIASVAVCLSVEGFSQREEKCDLAAYVADPYSGVNVRAAAGTDSRILKTIPRDGRGTLVFIDGSRGDWLRVSRSLNSKKTTVFSGIGWIHAPLLAVKTRGDGDDLVMYAEPKAFPHGCPTAHFAAARGKIASERNPLVFDIFVFFRAFMCSWFEIPPGWRTQLPTRELK